MGKILSWGKCTIKVTPIEGTGVDSSITGAVTFNEVVVDSTKLTTTQGSKNEAKIEGGAVEAVRYDANTYELVFGVRLHSTQKTPPIPGHDGVVNGEFSVEITPENSSAAKVKINRASANVQIDFTSANGVIANYTFSSLVVEDGEQITLS